MSHNQRHLGRTALACTRSAIGSEIRRDMPQRVDQEIFERLLPLAGQWAKAQEELILAYGHSLSARQSSDAFQVGVQNWGRIRLLIVDRIPMPDHAELAEVAARTQILTPASRAFTLGYGIIVRADSWGDRELLLHNFVHVAQCERAGGLEQWVREYLSDRLTCGDFSLGNFENEARSIAREICTREIATTGAPPASATGGVALQ